MYYEHNYSKCPIEKTMNVIGGKWTFIILQPQKESLTEERTQYYRKRN